MTYLQLRPGVGRTVPEIVGPLLRHANERSATGHS